VAAEDIAANAIGKAELRGTSWTARNVGEKPLARGERCTVERIEGLTIFIRAEQN
jgi:inner membrane protein